VYVYFLRIHYVLYEPQILPAFLYTLLQAKFEDECFQESVECDKGEIRVINIYLPCFPCPLVEWQAVCEKLEAVGVYPASPHDGPSAYNPHTHEIAPVLLLRIVNSIAPVLSVM
jgi:hypothetical protein